ncbi:MAG: glycosyltransferase [Erythrobacter sp.]|uniref:glycosyltransferase n=1 Tax=Erythrobacter sp. TaxID=1042 RepID=UPI0032EEC889
MVSFIDNTPGFRHVVYSLNRANWRKNLVAIDFDTDRTAIAYGAPPKGLLLESRLAHVTAFIKADLEKKGIAPDLFHAHKLTVEGLVAHRLSNQLGIPYIANIWGDTDIKFIAARKDMAAKWRMIMEDARRLLPCAPWTADRFIADHDLDPAKVEVMLPIVKQENFLPPVVTGEARIVTLFNLDQHKRKNLKGLLDAVVELRRRDPRVTLDIWGRGNAETLCDIDAMIAARGAGDYINLKGPLPQGAFETTLNAYTGFAMPTLRETFGMVFIEAMLCGLPVLHTRGWGIDGIYPDDMIGYAWDHSTQADIVAGLEHLIANEARLKESLTTLAGQGAFDQHKREVIVSQYANILETACADKVRDGSLVE